MQKRSQMDGESMNDTAANKSGCATVDYWEGRPISELSKDQLIDIIRDLDEENRRLTKTIFDGYRERSSLFAKRITGRTSPFTEY